MYAIHTGLVVPRLTPEQREKLVAELEQHWTGPCPEQRIVAIPRHWVEAWIEDWGRKVLNQ